MLALDPDGVIRALDAGENRVLMNQSRPYGKNQSALGELSRANEPDGVVKLMSVVEILRRNAPDAFDENIARCNALAESECGKDG